MSVDMVAGLFDVGRRKTERIGTVVRVLGVNVLVNLNKKRE
jgi:hypothetical protein